MNNRCIAFILMSVSIHITFIAFSYDSALLSNLDYRIDPVLIERALMLLQFLPLLIVVNSSRLSDRKILLFIAFAICLSTLYVVDDFNMGFYGAAIDYKAGIVPRMRASAQLMAYKDTGSLVSLDYHAEYFLEFALVHFVSEVTGLNYVFTYFFIIRIVMIVIWSLVFVWSSALVTGSRHQLVMLLLASSIMLASQGYNYEVSFAPVLLLIFYITARKQHARSFLFVALLIAVAILLASFRETLLLGLVSVIMLCIIPWNKKGRSTYSGFYASSVFFDATILILVFTRTFLVASYRYFQGYAHYLLRLVDSIITVLKGKWELQELPLSTLESVKNPLDATVALTSVIFAVSLLILVAILSARHILKRNRDSLSLTLSLAYILAFLVPISAYAVDKITGSGPLHDFSSNTILPRSLLPLVVLAIMPYLQNIKKIRIPAKKELLVLAIVYLSVTLVFAPLLFSRKEAKSSYDMLRVPRDNSEKTLLGNNLYEFVMSRVPFESRIGILSPATSFLQLYYALPLQYRTSNRIETGAVSIPLESKIFDNGIFTVSTYDASTIFLNESA